MIFENLIPYIIKRHPGKSPSLEVICCSSLHIADLMPAGFGDLRDPQLVQIASHSLHAAGLMQARFGDNW